MQRILILDSIASRYHCLPTEVLVRGSSLDVYIMDAALTYRNYKEQEALHKEGKGTKPVPNIPVNTLEEMMRRVKEGNGKANKDRKQNSNKSAK